VLRRFRFGRKAEHLNSVQGKLFEEEVDTDIAAIEEELHQLVRPSTAAQPRTTPKRQALPGSLSRIDLHHEPDSTTCSCGCQLQRIGQDISEKLNYVPGMARVERHIRGKWACRQCGTLTLAPVPAQVIDKGLPTAGMLAHVLVSKYADHLPLYRQKGMMERAG